MEILFDDEPKKGKAPGTRVYAPAETAAKDTAAHKRRAAPAPAPETIVDDDGFRIRVPKDEIRPASRIGLILCSFLLAGMILFMLTGYERISRAYADINTLKDAIELTELRIAELDVSIECAVTITDAQAAAEQAGMTYPTESQYIRIGSVIPVASASLAGTAPGESAGGETADGEEAAAVNEDGLPVETETND